MILVLLPHGSLPADVSTGAELHAVEWRVPEDIVRTLAALDPSVAGVVLMSDGLGRAALASIIPAVQAAGVPVVEVRGEQWDGFSVSPLARVCKGVVSGFGVEGARAAALALA